MHIEEFLAKKSALEKELADVKTKLSQAKAHVLEEFKKCISEFEIELFEVQGLFGKPVVAKTAGRPPKKADKKPLGHPYYCKDTGKSYGGVNPVPQWFDLSKADLYLVPGRTHTARVLKALKAKKSGKKA